MDAVRRGVIEARRAQILEASAQVFARKGYRRATTKEIARAAGVSEGTIYNYFASKSDLLIGMLNFLTDKDGWEEKFTGVRSSDFRDSISKIFVERLLKGRTNDALSSAVLSEVLIDPELRERFHGQRLVPLTAAFERYLGSVIESGQVRPLDVPLTVRVMFATFMGLQLLRLLGDPVLRKEHDAKLADTLAAIFLSGIAADTSHSKSPAGRGAHHPRRTTKTRHVEE